MPRTAKELKELLAGVPDDVPIRGTLQGEENWDWSVYYLDEEAVADSDEEFPEPTLVISMDL